jgi:hypothetical protein
MTDARRFLIVLSALALALFAFSLSFSPPEFRAWELLKRKDTVTFEASQSLVIEEIGDIGHKAWVRQLQHRRRVTFTTDRWGFRNPIDMDRADIVVLGDSYVVGSGVSDDETLTARLSALLGATVYNYGLQTGATPPLFLSDERFQRAPPRLVIYAPCSRNIKVRPVEFIGGWPPPKRPAGVAGHWNAAGDAVTRFVKAMNRDNGLAVEARYALNGLRYDLFGIPKTIDVEGVTVLPLSIEEQLLHRSPESRDAATVVRMLSALRARLARRNVRFVFAPVPEMGVIYADYYPPEERAKIRSPSMLDALFDGARAAGIEVVDLRAPLANDRLPYLYIPDDSHWNARAIGIAARAIADAL